MSRSLCGPPLSFRSVRSVLLASWLAAWLVELLGACLLFHNTQSSSIVSFFRFRVVVVVVVIFVLVFSFSMPSNCQPPSIHHKCGIYRLTDMHTYRHLSACVCMCVCMYFICIILCSFCFLFEFRFRKIFTLM